MNGKSTTRPALAPDDPAGRRRRGDRAALAGGDARRAARTRRPRRAKRFIVMFSANGTIPPAWTPTPGTGETDFALSPILAPLEAHKADLVVISGLEQKGGGGDGHQNGMGGMLTGQTLNAGPFAGVGAPPAGWPIGPSVDQRIAEGLAVPTKLRSLELGVQVGAADNWGRMIYRAANQPLPPDDDPASVYARVFADLHTDPAVLARLRRRRKSILDGVGGAVLAHVGAAGQRRSAAAGRAPDRGARDRDAPHHRPRRQQPVLPRPDHHARVGGRQRRLPGGGRAADGPAGHGARLRHHPGRVAAVVALRVADAVHLARHHRGAPRSVAPPATTTRRGRQADPDQHTGTRSSSRR